MLAVTDTAKRHLHQYLTAKDKPDTAGKCFRIVPATDDQALTLKLEKPEPDDEIYSHEGTDVLALPKSLQTLCSDRQLHINDDGKLFLS